MIANPFLGVVFHWLGGLASGSFYVPYRGVRKWSWEVYWLAGGFFSWIIAPWILALINSRDLLAVLGAAPTPVLIKAYIFGALWGIGGLTFGLTMRYLGMSLGHGRRPRLLRRDRHARPAPHPSRVRDQGPRDDLRAGHPDRDRRLHARDRRRRRGRDVQGTGDDRGAEEGPRSRSSTSSRASSSPPSPASSAPASPWAWTRRRRSPSSRPSTAPRCCGRACRSCASCSSADSRPTSSGA